MDEKEKEITPYGRRVREALDHAKLSQTKAAELLSARRGELVKPQNVQYAATKATTTDFTADLAAITGFRYEYIARGEEPKLSGQPPDHTPASTVQRLPKRAMVPLISIVTAGQWATAEDPYALGDAEEWLPCPDPHGARTYALRIKGESMFNPDGETSYADGDIVFIDPDVRAQHNEDVVVRLEDTQETTFKQLIEEGLAQYLKARNPDWKPRFVELKPGQATFCGVCIGKWVPRRRRR